MIIIDANLLVYAHVRDFEQHELARAWLDGQLAGATRVGLPWQSLTAFVRLCRTRGSCLSPGRVRLTVAQAAPSGVLPDVPPVA